MAFVLVTAMLAIRVLASNTTPALEIKAANVSFEGTVHLFYAVSHDNIENPNDIKLLVWKDEQIDNINECTIENAKYVLSPSTYTVNVNGAICKTFDYEELAAAEMTKNVYVRAYVEQGDEIVYSKVVKYSIIQYALNTLGITSEGVDDPGLADVLNKMLAYGAATQMYFEPNAERPLPTDEFVKIKVNGGTFADGTTSSLVKLGEEVTLYATTTDALPHAMWHNAAGNQLSANTNYTVKAKANTTYSATISDVPSSFGKYEHVVIIGVDGAGSFNAPTPYIDEIFANGSLTRKMRVTSPTSSAASWASMLHGALPMHTGVYENSIVEATDATYPMSSLFPSFLRQIVDTDPEAKVAVYSGWSGITNGILEDENLVNIPQTRDNDNNNVAAVKSYIAENSDFKAIFVQLNNPDAAGHNNGYVSDAYTNAITTADRQIGEIYEALRSAGILDTTLFMVTADHGGVNRTDGSGTGTHGGLSDAEKYCLFAIAGHSVADNDTGAVDMQIRDVAAISLYALGVTQPSSYTARVPSGVFDGVTASARPIFNDPNNYRDPVALPTPSYNGSNFVSNVIDNDLMVYLPFDGTADELVNNNNVTEKGTVSYENGYFGEAVVLDDGHLVMDNFAPGTGSFTVSVWVKTPAPEGTPPIFATRDRSAGSSSKGFLLALRRTANASGTNFTAEWSYATGSAAPDSYNNPYYLPEDFSMGWFHLTLIFNKENGSISIASDFGEFKTWNSSAYLTPELDLTNELQRLVFGNDLSENYSSKMGLSIDEFMIFEGALTRSEVNELATYYGHEGVPTISDSIGVEPSIRLDFDKSVVNLADGGRVNVVGTTTYTENGFSSQALLFRDDKTVVKVPDLKLGTDDFSAAFWIDINSLKGSTIPIFSTQHGEGGVSLGGTQGITFSVGINGTTGDKYFEFYFANGSKNAKVVTNLPENVEDLGWIHVAVVVDRATSTYSLYIDFKLATSEVLKYGTTVVPTTWTADGGKDTSAFTIGESGSGAYWNNLDAYIDEFMFFDTALSRKTIKSFANYYGKEGEPIIYDYLGFVPTLELDFDGNLVNKGSADATFDNVNMNYVDSPFGEAGNFTSVDQKKNTPEYWANSSDYTFSKEQEGGGYNDLTFSFWLSLATDMNMPGGDNTGTQWTSGDRIILATHDYQKKSTIPGMSLFLYSKPSKIKAKDLLANDGDIYQCSYLNPNDFDTDEQGYLIYKSGDFAGEYIYRQFVRLRMSAAGPDGVVVEQDIGAYFYAALGEWANISIVFDRGEYGVNDGYVKLYSNGNLLEYNSGSNKFAINDVIEDYGSLVGIDSSTGKPYGFMINDDVGHYPRDMEAYLDELVIFDQALTEEELAKLAEYYEAIRDKE